MRFDFDARHSDSPLVAGIWRTWSSGGGSFMSAAGCNLELVVTRQQGKTWLTVRGPETKASLAPVPEDAEFFGIIFKLGTFVPYFPPTDLLNGSVNLPEITGRSFWLRGSAWEFPTFENADVFVQRLVRDGLIAREPIVEAALLGQLQRSDLSPRSVQRRFLNATGLSQRAIVQIERARQAQALLERGVSILDTVELAGYADQPHLTRALKYFIGLTPAQIIAAMEA